MPSYTANDIAFFQARAQRLGLSYPPEFLSLGWESLAKICNGVGGGGSPLTPIINFVYARYQTSAAIHDVNYWLGGVEEERKAADKIFLANMLKEWADYWGWLRWLRPLARAERKQVLAAYLAVRQFGGKYFQHQPEETK